MAQQMRAKITLSLTIALIAVAAVMSVQRPPSGSNLVGQSTPPPEYSWCCPSFGNYCGGTMSPEMCRASGGVAYAVEQAKCDTICLFGGSYSSPGSASSYSNSSSSYSYSSSSYSTPSTSVSSSSNSSSSSSSESWYACCDRLAGKLLLASSEDPQSMQDYEECKGVVGNDTSEIDDILSYLYDEDGFGMTEWDYDLAACRHSSSFSSYSPSLSSHSSSSSLSYSSSSSLSYPSSSYSSSHSSSYASHSSSYSSPYLSRGSYSTSSRSSSSSSLTYDLKCPRGIAPETYIDVDGNRESCSIYSEAVDSLNQYVIYIDTERWWKLQTDDRFGVTDSRYICHYACQLSQTIVRCLDTEEQVCLEISDKECYARNGVAYQFNVDGSNICTSMAPLI